MSHSLCSAACLVSCDDWLAHTRERRARSDEIGPAEAAYRMVATVAKRVPERAIS